MMPQAAILPDDAAVVAAVAPLVTAVNPAGVTLVTRRPNPCFSSSYTEIVTLACADGPRRELFLKYDRDPDPEPRCRYGIAYCGQVHERLVRRMSLPHVPCLGLVAAGSPPVALLVFEHLAGALRVNETDDDAGVIAAAEWCGRLHAWGMARADDPALSFLVRHDRATYRGWATRARSLAAAIGPVPPWLARLYTEFESLAAALVTAEQTTIHGDFGPQNVLWRDGAAYPVDWESAAVGPGAIDLATLLFGWPGDTVHRATDAYWRARGVAPPRDFGVVFSAATLSACLRWLPDPARGDVRSWEEGIARLERAASRLV